MPGLQARPQGARTRSVTPTTLSRTVKTQGPAGGEKKGMENTWSAHPLGAPGPPGALLPDAADAAAAHSSPDSGPWPDPRHRLAEPGIADRLAQRIKFLIIQL